jgi:hypothetical protein
VGSSFLDGDSVLATGVASVGGDVSFSVLHPKQKAIVMRNKKRIFISQLLCRVFKKQGKKRILKIAIYDAFKVGVRFCGARYSHLQTQISPALLTKIALLKIISVIQCKSRKSVLIFFNIAIYLQSP